MRIDKGSARVARRRDTKIRLVFTNMTHLSVPGFIHLHRPVSLNGSFPVQWRFLFFGSWEFRTSRI